MRLPDFLILGGMRCGSTTLANILKSQPSVYLPGQKELHYFDQRSPAIKSLHEYSSCFLEANKSKLVGEATPDYFSTPGCMESIHSVLPDARLIVILRDPVKRAWSHYRFSVATEREIEPFENALNLEAERLAHPIHEHDIYFSYQQRGRYIEHIEHFMSQFDRSQLHILFLEELIAQPQQTVEHLFKFLQIEHNDSWQREYRITNQASLVNIRKTDDLDKIKKRNLNVNKLAIRVLNSRLLNGFPQRLRDRAYRKIESALNPLDNPDKETMIRLNQYFKPYNQQLEEFLDRKLPW